MSKRYPKLELYGFSKLEEWMDRQSYPAASGEGGFRIIKDVDFEKAMRAGNISFENGGIYLKYGKKKYRGYMFIQDYYVTRYSSFPKFHLTDCKTIREFIDAGRFRQRYVFANSRTNTVFDKGTEEVYEDKVLDCCYNCKKALRESIPTTEDFYDSLDKSEMQQEEKKVEVDVFGYTLNWERTSRAYREEQDYTCESCGVECKSGVDRRFWHVDHKDGNKLNNRKSNLQCLCIVCHANKDAAHKKQFGTKANQRAIASFKERYGDQSSSFRQPPPPPPPPNSGQVWREEDDLPF